MQRAAGTFRMVPDPQTAKRGSGTKRIWKAKLACTSPFRIPKNCGVKRFFLFPHYQWGGGGYLRGRYWLVAPLRSHSLGTFLAKQESTAAGRHTVYPIKNTNPPRDFLRVGCFLYACRAQSSVIFSKSLGVQFKRRHIVSMFS